MHEEASKSSIKQAYQKISKSPIGVKAGSQIFHGAHELEKRHRQAKEWWNGSSYMLFHGENRGGCVGQKTSSPHLV